jgi:2-keto-3-deoxy-L-rhamnonate aldolase RhmA
VREADAATSVVVQCEHAAAVEAIDAIARVEGVDAVLAGPYDLSGSLGRLGEIDHPEVQTAIRRVRDACKRAGRPLGIYVPDIERARVVLAQGYTLVAVGMDATLLGAAAASVANALRG